MEEQLESVRRFAAGEIAPHAAKVDRGGQLPAGLLAKLGQQGLTGLAIPTRWGGVEADLPFLAASMEIMGAACASTAWTLLTHTMCSRAIVAFGSEALKDALLPDMAAGKLLGGIAVTEAGGGSNPTGMRTRAARKGDGWELNGRKEFISLCTVADAFVVMARTGDKPADLSCLLVRRNDAGFSAGQPEELMGLHGVPVGGLAFEHCALPAERLLGQENAGPMVMGAAGGWGLTGATAAAMGIAQAALDQTRTYVQERVVAGTALAQLPAVQATLGDLGMQLSAARAQLQQALAALGQIKGPPIALFTAKIGATECAWRVVDRCMALHGVAGYSRALPLERQLRDVRAFGIHWANNEVLRDTVRKASVS